MIFSEFRPWFDQRFSLLLDEKIAAFSGYSHSEDVAQIAAFIKMLGTNGKRFRPFLVSIAAGEVDHEEHFLLYGAVELLHLFALIHDDIMDNAETRHEVPCAHKKFIPKYGEHTSGAIAILMGDIVFSWAYDSLMQYLKDNPSKKDRLFEEFKTLVEEVTHGQILDIISPQQSAWSKDLIVEKMMLKTARYSFVQPLKLGFIVKGDNKNDQKFAEDFGVSLGIAFQLQDDLIDTFPTIQTGKSRFTDIQTGQQTLLSWYFFEKASLKHKQKFTSVYGKIFSEEDEVLVDQLLLESGAYEYVRQEIFLYIEKARQALLTQSEKEKWESIILLIEQRKK